MIWRLALAPLRHRPWRSALLFAGFGLGVGVMIVLLSIGEAMMAQARDEKLVGGGDVTVLPDGLDLEVMKTGGIGGLFFSIPNARFVHRQLLAAPRLGADVRAAAPQIAEKLVYLRIGDRTIPARGVGEIPSLTAAVGAAPALAAGRWDDQASDRAWRAPTPRELIDQMDHFHTVPAAVADSDRMAWGEWHYFNVTSADGVRWAFITLMLAGDVPRGRWGGQVLVTLHARGRPARRFSARVAPSAIAYDTARADLVVGASSVRVTDAGTYEVRVSAPSEEGGAPVRIALDVEPAPRRYFPGADLGGGTLVSGYAVPALRADGRGTICVGASCERLDGVPAYHDHNWGTWRQVNWEWGAARAGDLSFLFGRVQSTDPDAAVAPIFLYLTDSLGFRTLFRPKAIAWEDGREIVVDGARVRVPSRGTMTDVRGADTLIVTLEVDDAVGTDTRRGLVERGQGEAARRLAHPYFVQMQGRVSVSGRLGGAPVAARGAGFFETYR